LTTQTSYEEQAGNRTIKQPDDTQQIITWTFFKAHGCAKCADTGYQGRKAIYEVFKINEEMRNTIYKTRDLIELKKAALSIGAWNLRASAWRKAVKGITSIEEVLAVTTANE